MEKDRGFKVIAIIALVIAIVGVSIGFAAFSETLQINTEASVTPEDNFKVQFSNADGALTSGTITQDVASTSGTSGSAVISSATPTIADITANFIKPGDTVILKLFITNNSDYVAYLKKIEYTQVAATCTGDIEQTLRDAACDKMKMNISIGSVNASYLDNFTTNSTLITVNNSISAKNESTLTSVPVTITLTYDSAGGSAFVDGIMNVNFGTINLEYSTAN